MHEERSKHNPAVLQKIANATKLKEGEEGIRRILREIYRNKRVGTKELAYLTQIPIPIVAAIRKELEREGLITREKGALLTHEGEKFAKEQLGLTCQQRLTCPTCRGKTIRISDHFVPLLGELRKHLALRPKPLTWLDQAYGTPENALQRALYMLEKGDVEGRSILFLGDDDFTSIATGLLRAAGNITVIDIDARLLEAIRLISQEEHFAVNCLEHDLRKPLPRNLRSQYDVVFTDPPYTNPGLTLFLSRGLEALRQREGASIYLAYAHQPPRKMLVVQKTLSAMGLAITELIPRFNTYEGAEMFANTTFLTRLETTAKSRPLVTEAFEGKLYTGEITQTTRVYQCGCGEQVNVGRTEPYPTIEELKTKGCPKCGKHKGFKLISKKRLKEILAQKLTLRSFRWSDFPAVLEFEREIARKSFPEAPILDEEYHREKLEKATENVSEGLKVAVIDDEIVGWLWLKIEKDRSTNERFGYIKSIIVKPEHRHQEFGKRLIEAAEEFFLSKGIRRIDLIVSAANYSAGSFFEEVGYDREHSTMRKLLNQKAEGD